MQRTRMDRLEREIAEAERTLQVCADEINPVYESYSPEHVDDILCDIRRARAEYGRTQERLNRLLAERETLAADALDASRAAAKRRQQRETRRLRRQTAKANTRDRTADRATAELTKTP